MLDCIEHEHEHEKKHEQSIGPKCSIERFCSCDPAQPVLHFCRRAAKDQWVELV